MKLQRRPLAESLRYLADMLVETASGLDDGPSARVGGVAVTLHMLADEEEGVGVFAPDHSDGPGPEESDTSGTYREGDVTVLGDLIGSEQIDGSPEAT